MRKENKNEVIVYANEDELKLSNRFIRAKYNATMLDNKIIAISLTRIQKNLNGNKDLEVEYTPSEISKLTGIKNTSGIYKRLKSCADRLQGVRYIVEDQKHNTFESIVIVPYCRYENGKFTVRFDKAVRKHIYQIAEGFTRMSLSVLCSFDNKKTSAAYRIYQLLKSESYAISKNHPSIIVSYDYYDFLLKIGQIDLTNSMIAKEIESGRSSKEIVRLAIEHTTPKMQLATNVSSPRVFMSKVLRPALEEINEKTDLSVELFDTGGKGKAIRKVNFRVKNKGQKESRKNDQDILNLLILFDDVVPGISNIKDKIAIIEASGHDINRIEAIYQMAQRQDEVRDLVAWMIAGLNGGWDNGSRVHIVRGSNADLYQSYADIVNEAADEDIIDID